MTARDVKGLVAGLLCFAVTGFVAVAVLVMQTL